MGFGDWIKDNLGTIGAGIGTFIAPGIGTAIGGMAGNLLGGNRSNSNNFISDLLLDTGSKYILNKVISEPNSAIAFEQQKELQKRQFKYNQDLAIEAYNRSDIAAGKAYERNAREALLAWQRSESSALNAYNRSKEAAKISYDRSREASLTQWEREVDAYRNRYQWTMEDMRKAGLNPILAASGGFKVSGQPSVALAQAPMASAPMASAYSAQAPMATSPAGSVGLGSGFQPRWPESGQSALAFRRSKIAKEEVEKVRSEILLNVNKSKEVIVKIANTRAITKLTVQNEKNEIQRFKNLQAEFKRIAVEIMRIDDEMDKLHSQAQLNWSQRKYYVQLRRNLVSERKKINEVAKQIKLVNEKLAKIANVYSGPSGKNMAFINELIKAISPFAPSLSQTNR